MIALYTYVLRVRIALGYWPLPAHPDPKDLDYCYHHVLIYLFIFATVPAFYPAMLLFVIMWFWVAVGWVRGEPVCARSAHVILWGIAWGAFHVLFRYDPGNFLVWFLD